jgi:hypothetical protein
MPTLINPSDQTITQYNVQTGGASNLLNNVAPTATVGVPLISQNASTQPIFGTALVAGGGTGNTTFTAYSIITAGTTATGAFQNVVGLGSSGNVLTSAGAGALPAWQAPAAGSITITGDSGGGLTGASFTFTGGTTGLTFAGAGSTETLGGDLVVANGGTGNTTFTAYSVICAGTTATGAFQNVSGLGVSGSVLTSAGAGALPAWQAPVAGTILQQVRTSTTSGYSGTNLVASFTATPTTGTMTSGLNLTITPKSASSKLIFNFQSMWNITVGTGACFAIYNGSSIIYATGASSAVTTYQNEAFQFILSSPGTSSVTYTIYFAPVSGSASTMYLNQLNGSTAFFNSLPTQSFIITEVVT